MSPCLFNLYAYITTGKTIALTRRTSLADFMRNAGLEEAQAGLKIARRNINNLKYADDTTLIAESEELKSLLMKVKQESDRVGLKLSIQCMILDARGWCTETTQRDGTGREEGEGFRMGNTYILVADSC